MKLALPLYVIIIYLFFPPQTVFLSFLFFYLLRAEASLQRKSEDKCCFLFYFLSKRQRTLSLHGGNLVFLPHDHQHQQQGYLEYISFYMPVLVQHFHLLCGEDEENVTFKQIRLVPSLLFQQPKWIPDVSRSGPQIIVLLSTDFSQFHHKNKESPPPHTCSLS